MSISQLNCTAHDQLEDCPQHPSLTANEAITESRRIMNGNKWRLFCLDFSFIGWELLCSVPLYAEGFLVLKYFTGSEALAISLIRRDSVIASFAVSEGCSDMM